MTNGYLKWPSVQRQRRDEHWWNHFWCLWFHFCHFLHTKRVFSICSQAPVHHIFRMQNVTTNFDCMMHMHTREQQAVLAAPLSAEKHDRYTFPRLQLPRYGWSKCTHCYLTYDIARDGSIWIAMYLWLSTATCGYIMLKNGYEWRKKFDSITNFCSQSMP